MLNNLQTDKFFFFFFNDTATTEIYTLSLHDALPISYNQIWFDPSSKILPDRRTSLIVDPPDGRIPFTPEGAKAQERSRQSYGRGDYSSWLGLDTGERCLTDGPPIYWSGYNNNYKIVQSPGYVTILHELYREVRVIPLDGRPAPHI